MAKHPEGRPLAELEQSRRRQSRSPLEMLGNYLAGLPSRTGPGWPDLETAEYRIRQAAAGRKREPEDGTSMRHTAAEGAEMMAVLPDLGGILTAGGKMAKVPAKIAEEMAAAGRTQKEIWDETGWWVNTPEGTRVIGDKPLREIVDPPDVAIQKWGAETLTRREAKQAQLDEQQQIADTAKRMLSEMKKGRTLEEVAADLQTSNLPDRAKNMVITQVRSGKPQPPSKWDQRFLENLWPGPES